MVKALFCRGAVIANLEFLLCCETVTNFGERPLATSRCPKSDFYHGQTKVGEGATLSASTEKRSAEAPQTLIHTGALSCMAADLSVRMNRTTISSWGGFA